MRYIYPSVGEVYRKLFKNNGVNMECVFKPGLKRVYGFPEGALGSIDTMWVKELLSKARINIDL